MTSDITRILEEAQGGDRDAADRLLPLVYRELRQLAARKLAREPAGQTLQATALVHEAYLRLTGGTDPAAAPSFENRRHFFAAAAEAMRRILVDNARKRNSLKRGGDKARADVEPADLAAPQPSDDVLAVHESLDKLAATDATAAELVKLRYFAGLTLPEAADVLQISTRTADRLWAYARAWLHREISGG
jgi:RNA polymerase sigma factor (TIGR02999 family)